jgi:hypothetical protein
VCHACGLRRPAENPDSIGKDTNAISLHNRCRIFGSLSREFQGGDIDILTPPLQALKRPSEIRA